MSTALAIASVTAVLKSLLENRLIQHGVAASVGDVAVTALPPDRVSTGSDERTQLNLFLYRVTPNTRWRRSAAPTGNGHEPDGTARLTDRPAAPQPPLGLDLHYLLTAYGEQDLHAEILLGHAIQLLHEVTILSREQIEAALASPNVAGGASPAARAALASGGLAEQVEQLSVTPEFSGTEEMSRLWSALQARYRPSAAYKVSTVLLDARAGSTPRESAAPAGKAAAQLRRR